MKSSNQSAAARSTGRARVAVAGATGYAGQELVRLLARHPMVEFVAAADIAPFADHPLVQYVPALARVWDGVITLLEPQTLAREADLVFLALPETPSAEIAPVLVDAGVRVIDISGAFRLRDHATRARWYPDTHQMPDGVVYGLTELARPAIADARLLSNPGCYPTASLLALAPLANAGLLAPGADIIVDAKSGVSGAGKTPSARTHFSELHGSVAAYGVFGHRHGVEIAQGVAEATHDGSPGFVSFVPHLVPLDRGILATIHVRLAPGSTDDSVAAAYERAYADAFFVRRTGAALPEIKHVARTNFCDIGWRVDAPTGRAVVVSVIDNLLKGAAGQAIQNMNVMLGLDERTGLL